MGLAEFWFFRKRWIGWVTEPPAMVAQWGCSEKMWAIVHEIWGTLGGFWQGLHSSETVFWQVEVTIRTVERSSSGEIYVSPCGVQTRASRTVPPPQRNWCSLKILGCKGFSPREGGWGSTGLMMGSRRAEK